jgi:hypothetical protein
VNRKKILRRSVTIGAVLLLAGAATAAVGGWQEYQHHRRERAQREALAAQMAKEYQAYLDETAKRIKGVPVDPKIVGDIQTRHFQQPTGLRLYVWAIDNQGGFVFGVPGSDFTRLNSVFDQYQATIVRDNHYASRDQFLRTLLHEQRRISAPRETADDRDSDSDRDANWWRFHRQDDAWDGGNVLFLSSPIQDAAGATVGNLNLKLVGIRSQRLPAWDDPQWDHVLGIGGVIAVLSLGWLWFMLPTWVYVDAQERGVPRPLLWSLLTLIGNVFALMVYLISRPAEVADLRCPQCAKTLNGMKAGCPYCGADLSSSFCSHCQYPVKRDWSFCPSCRSSLVRGAAAVATGNAATT